MPHPTFLTITWLSLTLIAGAALAQSIEQASAGSPPDYLWARAWHIMPETTTDESGYFSLNEGKDGLIYVGTAAYGRNAYLVEFNPATQRQRIAIDSHKALGLPLTPTGYAAQAKIHTRNHVGESGRIYVGTKQGYPTADDEANNVRYPGGYVIAYDPATRTTTNLGMPYPTQGLIDVVADESRGLIYVVTCEDQHWMLYESSTGSYRELREDLRLWPYATTLIDERGRAHAMTDDGRIARYDPATDRVTIVQMVLPDGTGFDEAWMQGPPTWVLRDDGRTAHLIFMSRANLFTLDLGGPTDEPVPTVDCGRMIEGENPDSRSALAIGAVDGNVYALIGIDNNTGFGTGRLHHMVMFDRDAQRMVDLGVLAVENPDFYGRALSAEGAVDDAGRRIAWTQGFQKLPDRTLAPLIAHMALISDRKNNMYATIICPYTLLKVSYSTIQDRIAQK